MPKLAVVRLFVNVFKPSYDITFSPSECGRGEGGVGGAAGGVAHSEAGPGEGAASDGAGPQEGEAQAGAGGCGLLRAVLIVYVLWWACDIILITHPFISFFLLTPLSSLPLPSLCLYPFDLLMGLTTSFPPLLSLPPLLSPPPSPLPSSPFPLSSPPPLSSPLLSSSPCADEDGSAHSGAPAVPSRRGPQEDTGEAR